MLLMLLAVREAELLAPLMLAVTVPFPWSEIATVFAELSPRTNMAPPSTAMLTAGQLRSSRTSKRGGRPDDDCGRRRCVLMKRPPYRTGTKDASAQDRGGAVRRARSCRCAARGLALW